MGIKDLPRPGSNNFRMTGAGSFPRKFSDTTRYGPLKNLRDNQEAIIKALKRPTTLREIKRGGLSRIKQLAVRREIQASDKTITKEDKREIKEVLRHLGKGAAAAPKKSMVDAKSVKVNNGKNNLTEEQIKRNLAGKSREDKVDVRSRIRAGVLQTTHFAGGDVQVVTRKPIAERSVFAGGRTKEAMETTKGTAADLGFKVKQTGFASGYKNSKLPNNSAPKTPSAGTRPLGL